MTWGKEPVKQPWYAVLRISPDATPDAIDKKYRQMRQELTEARNEGSRENG
jgi:hypothetical protein